MGSSRPALFVVETGLFPSIVVPNQEKVKRFVLINSFNNRNIDIYTEVPPIFATGNGGIRFYPKGDVKAGLYDSNGDTIPDRVINGFDSFANAANNIFNEEIAACITFTNNPVPPMDHYTQPGIWKSNQDFNPDMMPEFADSGSSPTTDETQFIQLSFPFNIDPAAIRWSRLSICSPWNMSSIPVPGSPCWITGPV